MKRHGIWMYIFVFTIAASLVMILPAFAQEKAKPEGPPKEKSSFKIARLVVGTGVENKEPVGVAETFPAATEKVYCFLEAIDITEDVEVSFVWFHGQKEMRKFSLPLKKGSRWRTYAFKNLFGLEGDWKVEIKDAQGNLIKEVTFSVK